MPLPDIWAQSLYEGSFAGQPIDIVKTEDDVNRAIARNTYPRKDGADLQDMGGEPRTTRCEVVFFEKPDEPELDDHLTRLSLFINNSGAGKPQEFIHPLFGSYLAYAENITFSADADNPNAVFVSVEFIEDSTEPAVIYGPAAAPPQVGTAAVAAMAADYNAKIAGLNLPAGSAALTVGDDAQAMVSSWETDPDLSVRDVNSELSEISDTISDALLELNYATDITNMPIVKTLLRLQATVRRAAELFRQDSPQVITHVVQQATSLWALVTSLYGASQAAQRYDEMMRLNAITDPSAIPIGVTLRRLSGNPAGATALSGFRGAR